MKRYFLFTTPPDPTQFNPRGQYHYVSLPGSGYVCVVEEESVDPPADWVELPHLLDSSPANLNGVNPTPGAVVSVGLTPAVAPLAGILPTDTTYQIAKKLVALGLKVFHP